MSINARRKLSLQRDETDCGPACLASLAEHYGLSSSVAAIRDLAGTDQDGTTLLGLAEAADSIGLLATGFSADIEALHELTLPAIAHWGENHYVVVWELNGKSVAIGDPAEGLKTISVTEFQQNWSGYMLVLQKKESGRTVAGSSAGRLRRFVALLAPRWTTTVEATICSLILAVLSLTWPIAIQLLTDHVLINQDIRTLNWFMTAVLGLLIFTGFFNVLRRYLLAHLGRWLDIRLMQSYYNHVMALPYKFLANRKVGEVLSRFNDASKIRQMLGGTAILAIVDVLTTMAALGLMFAYQWKLALLSVAFLPLFAITFAGFNPVVRRRARRVMELGAEGAVTPFDEIMRLLHSIGCLLVF